MIQFFFSLSLSLKKYSFYLGVCLNFGKKKQLYIKTPKTKKKRKEKKTTVPFFLLLFFLVPWLRRPGAGRETNRFTSARTF